MNTILSISICKQQRKRLCIYYKSSRWLEERKGFGRSSCVVAALWLVADERCSLQRNEPLCFVGAQTHVFPIMLLLLSRPSEYVDHDFLDGRSCLVSPVVFVFHRTVNGFLGGKNVGEKDKEKKVTENILWDI